MALTMAGGGRRARWPKMAKDWPKTIFEFMNYREPYPSAQQGLKFLKNSRIFGERRRAPKFGILPLGASPSWFDAMFEAAAPTIFRHNFSPSGAPTLDESSKLVKSKSPQPPFAKGAAPGPPFKKGDLPKRRRLRTGFGLELRLSNLY